MNEVKIDLKTYNDLYERAELKLPLEQEKNQQLENELKEKELAIQKLNTEIDSLLSACIQEDTNIYKEIETFNIDDKKLSLHLNQYLLRIKSLRQKEAGESDE